MTPRRLAPRCASTMDWPARRRQGCHASQRPANHYGGQCSACHDPAQAGARCAFDHGLAGADCQGCHASQRPTDHYGGQCSACHDPAQAGARCASTMDWPAPTARAATPHNATATTTEASARPVMTPAQAAPGALRPWAGRRRLPGLPRRPPAVRSFRWPVLGMS